MRTPCLPSKTSVLTLNKTQMSQFHAREVRDEDLRPTHEVFGSSQPKPDSDFKARFASSGKFDSAQLTSGTAEPEPESAPDPVPVDEDGPDPNDKRTLYECLQEQKDAKQEEWEEKHKFKNQMDHWRLDEDDAAFEEDRLKQMAAQEALAAQRREEGSQFYKLARAAQERTIPALPAPSAQKAKFGERPAEQGRRNKRPALGMPIAAVKVVKPNAGAAVSNAVSGKAQAPASTQDSPACLLPGMGEYSDSDDDD